MKKIVNLSKNSELAGKVLVADSFFKRIRGLLGRKELESGEALIITPCQQIHTFFMRFPIDIVFLDAKFKVVSLHSNLPPWRITPLHWQAKLVIELPANTIIRTQTVKGDLLSF